MAKFIRKNVKKVILPIFTFIMSLWCWAYIISVVVEKHYSSVEYYYDLDYLSIFRYTDHLLILLIPLFFILKIVFWYKYLQRQDKVKQYLSFLRKCYGIISLLFLPHIIYWSYLIIIYSTVGYFELAVSIRVVLIVLYLVLTYLSLLSFRNDLNRMENLTK